MAAPKGRLPSVSAKGPHTQGFTLLELSIVMLIMGLLVGGILVGRDMISHSEIHQMVSEIKEMQIAIRNFKDRYATVPGDFPRATSYWPTATTDNGNGNGYIDSTLLTESQSAFHHMVLAGVYRGGYGSGDGPSNGATYQSEWNMKKSRVRDIDYAITNNSVYLGSPFPAFDQTVILMGKGVDWVGYTPQVEALTRLETSTIDRKMDDGMPNTGTIMGSTGAGAPSVNCTAGGVYLSGSGDDIVSCVLAVWIE
jgi:prepilin-type N-terminal cleavage/methylation domain-containing protein